MYSCLSVVEGARVTENRIFIIIIVFFPSFPENIYLIIIITAIKQGKKGSFQGNVLINGNFDFISYEYPRENQKWIN